MEKKWQFWRTRLFFFTAAITIGVAAIVVALVISTLGDEFKNREDDLDNLIDAACFFVVAAFTVWLSVRLFNRRTKLGRKFWIAAAASAATLIYALSFGPACRLCEDGYLDGRATWIAFRPMTWLAVRGPYRARRVIWRWVNVFRFDPQSTESDPISHEFEVQYPDIHWL